MTLVDLYIQLLMPKTVREREYLKRVFGTGDNQRNNMDGVPGRRYEHEAEYRHGALVTGQPMCITRPDWPANSIFFAFSRPLAEGWPSSAGRWPRLLIGEKILDSSL